MQPKNLLFILSDQHNREVMGCSGHPIVKTPNLDLLANSGTRFTNAYTPSPICVPARAALATGRYVHDVRFGITQLHITELYEVGLIVCETQDIA